MEREQGTKMTDIDSAWALNVFARMRCDSDFSSLSTTKIIEKVSEWSCMSSKTLIKLIKNDGKT